MMPPPKPHDELVRLRSLKALDVLDTMAEERFDRITRLACRLFDVPIALVSLVDEGRQWFKSRQGVNVCETSREVSFCGHTILSEAPLVVTDSLLDPRFADNPLVVGAPFIRFYAGHPIHEPCGARVGTLCLIDVRPRTLTDEDLALLGDLAAIVDREFALMEHATTDELTGLANRRGFGCIIERMQALCRRGQRPATLVEIDLDNFKKVNDQHGHQAGDEALRAFAEMVRGHFRKADVIARLGGDEYAVWCNDASADGIATSLRRLETTFESSELARRFPTLSWSAGLVEVDPRSPADISELMHEADAKMYVAKSQSKRRAASAGR